MIKRLLLLVTLLMASACAAAQVTPGTLTLTASPTSCKSGCTPTLTWSTTPDPNGSPAASCTASGAWSGTEPTSGTFTVPPITGASAIYTLTCTWTDSTITYTWTAPTTNTDGSAITLLPLTYSLFSGTTNTSPLPTLVKSGITGLIFTLSGQGTTSLFYAITATDSGGDASAQSNILQAFTGSATAPASVTVIITKTPNAPGGYTIVVSK